MRRLFALIVLVAIAGAAYYSRYRAADVPDAREALGSVSRTLQATRSAAAVKAVLALDRELDGHPIDVDPGDQEGVVVLRGEVPSEELRAAAGARAAAARGMAFSLHRELKGTDIGVRSYRRQVTLTGQVDSPAQRQVAVEVAGRTPDVAGVADQISVRGTPAPAAPAATPAGPGAPRAAAGQDAPGSGPNGPSLATL